MIGPCPTPIRPIRRPPDAFATRAVHAGAEPDEADRRRLAADLPDLDLRPGRRRPAARRLRVRAQPEPDPRAARARGRGPRGRPPRDRVRERLGDDGGDRPARRRGRRDPRRRRRLRRHVPLLRARPPARRAAGRASYVDLASGDGRAVGGPDRADAPRLVRDAVEPAAQGHRHRGRGRDHPRPRGAGGPGAAARRRRQHVRVARAPAAARARRRHRVPLGHQVPRRPLGHDPRRSRSRATTRSPSGCGSSRTRWAACPGRSTASSSCAASGRSPCGWSATAPNATGGRPVPRGRDDVAWVGYPGLDDGRHAHPGHAIAARQMRLGDEPAFGGMVSFMPARRRPRTGGRAAERAIAVCESARLFTLGESLGGVESLIEVPAAMTHLSVAGVARSRSTPRSCGCRSGSRTPAT